MAPLQAKAEKAVKQRRQLAAQESARARAQYEQHSLEWCEKLFVPVDAATLRQAARYLTPEDYDGVIVERAAEGLCGYPLCSRTPQTIDKRFHISLSQRKVFDISEHGNYCGSKCMVGSRFYRLQLPEDPVYMRKRGADLDIDVLPLDYDSAAVLGAGAHGKTREDGCPPPEQQPCDGEEGALEWYRRSLVRKMNIPETVATASPLKIVEHAPGDAKYDVADAIDRLTFADVEGFKPEKDEARIKKAVRTVGAAAAPKEARDASVGRRAATGETNKAGVLAHDNDADGVLRVVVKGQPPEAEQMLNALWHSDSDSASDDDGEESRGPAPPAGSSNHFARLFAGEASRHGQLSMSLFGRMWSLVDIVATKSTAALLRDLAHGGPADQLRERAAGYYASPDDESMATRHELFAAAMERELDELRPRLHIATTPGAELRMLVWTLELRSNMVVFSKEEHQLLCLVLLLALARALPELGRELERPATAAALDTALGSLGTDRSLLGAIAGRLHEPC
ncbi:hypothetical protein IWQ57_003787 [Coemansia nantahalensis]|uniref:Uncharacterized protein n=1 Tax=Coemansia nantahalensis TaxID=2789366 RepID=A0ACC1JUN5_9FUNG|nr:hypothetical protein IWQ57_003787 [Coemansia nantahalensis]